MRYSFLLFYVLIFQCCNQYSTEKKMVKEIATANGVNNFHNVQMLEFTFNTQWDTSPPSSRHWQWFPKANEIVFTTDSSTTRFKRYDTTTQDLKKLNAQFTNDEYWLLYPFHLYWDEGLELRDSSMKVAPISGKSMRKITSAYNEKDGFTPGNMYDVYIDDNNRIQEWAFHESSSSGPGLITTWENYKSFNGLQLAQEHKSQDGKFRLWFTGIQVK